MLGWEFPPYIPPEPPLFQLEAICPFPITPGLCPNPSPGPWSPFRPWDVLLEVGIGLTSSLRLRAWNRESISSNSAYPKPFNLSGLVGSRGSRTALICQGREGREAPIRILAFKGECGRVVGSGIEQLIDIQGLRAFLMDEEGRGGSHPRHSRAFQRLWIEGLGREFQLQQLHWEPWEALGVLCRLQSGFREVEAIQNSSQWKSRPGRVQHKSHTDTG